MNKVFLKVIIPLVLLAAPFLLPTYYFAFDISTLLTVVSLIFAILVGFFIAASTTNYLRLQSLIADEDSALISVFDLSKVIQPSMVSKMREVIDRYAIAALDFELIEYINKTHKEFNDVITAISALSPQDEKGLELLGNLHDKKDQVVRARQEIAFVARRIVTWRHWIIIISLAVLLVFLLLALRDGHWLFSSIVGVLSLATYLVLTLLYEIDGNIFSEEQLAYENSQQIFQAIGTMKYFPSSALENKRIKEPEGDYRIGVLENSEKEIKIIRKGS